MTWVIWKQFNSPRNWTQVHATRDFNQALCGKRINSYEYRHLDEGFEHFPKCKRCVKLTEAATRPQEAK